MSCVEWQVDWGCVGVRERDERQWMVKEGGDKLVESLTDMG